MPRYGINLPSKAHKVDLYETFVCITRRGYLHERDKRARGRKNTALPPGKEADAYSAERHDTQKPVSYTHLDVYKRQIMLNAAVRNGLGLY